MEIKLNDEKIIALKNDGEILLEIEATEQNISFLDNWYFLNRYSETNKYQVAFKLVYN